MRQSELELKIALRSIKPIISDLSKAVQEAFDALPAATAEEPSTPTTTAKRLAVQRGLNAMNDTLRPNHYYVPLDGLTISELEEGNEEAMASRDYIEFEWWPGEEHNPTVFLCTNNYTRPLQRSIIEVIIMRLQTGIGMTYDFSLRNPTPMHNMPVMERPLFVPAPYTLRDRMIQNNLHFDPLEELVNIQLELGLISAY